MEHRLPCEKVAETYPVKAADQIIVVSGVPYLDRESDLHLAKLQVELFDAVVYPLAVAWRILALCNYTLIVLICGEMHSLSRLFKRSRWVVKASSLHWGDWNHAPNFGKIPAVNNPYLVEIRKRHCEDANGIGMDQHGSAHEDRNKEEVIFGALTD